MTRSPTRSAGCTLLGAALLAVVFAAQAQTQSQSPAQPRTQIPAPIHSPDQESQELPPVLASEQPAGLDLLTSVRQALTRNTSILVSATQVDVARGQLLTASSQFDTNLTAGVQKQRAYTAATTADMLAGTSGPTTTNTTFTTTLQASQQLRNGITVTPAVSFGRTSDIVGSNGPQSPNRATVGLTVTIPLQRNSGFDVVGANEKAAEQEVRAVRLDQTQAVSQTTFNVVAAYWQYLAAETLLKIAAEAEAGTAHRTQDTSRLVQDEMIPAADRDLAIADEASKRQARTAAEQSLVEARSSLARLLGMSASQARALPLPIDAFPDADPADVTLRLPLIRDMAIERRADLAAIQIRYDESNIILNAVRKNLKPQVDLLLGVSANGLREGDTSGSYFGAAGSNVRGPNIVVGLSYQFPVQNRAATGQLIQRQGALDQLDINRHDLSDAILTNVDTLASSVRRLSLQLADVNRSVALYTKSVANEEIRHQLGRSTLIDVLNISDRLLQARQTLTNIQLNYANAIAQLRFASGTLMVANGDALSLERATLTTAP